MNHLKQFPRTFFSKFVTVIIACQVKSIVILESYQKKASKETFRSLIKSFMNKIIERWGTLGIDGVVRFLSDKIFITFSSFL